MFKRGILIFFLLLIQGCQHHKMMQNTDDAAAAAYNTELGLAYLKQGDRVRAQNKLLTAWQENPHSATVNGAMAYYMEQTGELKQARTYYLNAIKLGKNEGAPLNNYGAFLCRHKKYKEAEQYFLKAVSDVHYAHKAGAYENAGLCIMTIDKKRAAIYFTKALEHDPMHKQSLQMLLKMKH